MEELQDAIEDAQYVNATTEDGPRPMLHWEVPSAEALEEWKQLKAASTRRSKLKDDNTSEEESYQPLTPEWYMSHPIGFFLFSQFIKSTYDDYTRLNFVEDVIRYRKLRSRYRCEKARKIVRGYLKRQTPQTIDPENRIYEIVEYDIHIPPHMPYSRDFVDKMYEDSIDRLTSDTPIWVKNSQLLKETLEKSAHTATVKASSTSSENKIAHVVPSANAFDKLQIVVFDSLIKQYWSEFESSEDYNRMINFFWYEDRRVVEEDFFVMRVLGRGGFGMVKCCRKATSGKLYAMKVMDKKRIKLKKSEQLTLNECMVLTSINSPFVVNLKYAFQSKHEIFLILDLMTGGDLSFHLAQNGFFPKNETLYYGARIMLGLQALHDKNFVYRDLKPENCLVADDGKVKLTDLGLACKITPTLHGAAGTRGYWAPEMLRRDKNGRRMPYGHTVDWFSFGCLMSEFISGTNPFRSETSINYGFEKGHKTKEKAMDCATLEMDPPFDLAKFDDESIDLCRKLLLKDEKARLGYKGCEDIMSHPYFSEVNWELILSDKKIPPFIPPKDINAPTQKDIGAFTHDKVYEETSFGDEDNKIYKDWNWTNPSAYASEVIEFLIYERKMGCRLEPIQQSNGCCCTIS